jgi:hypothetical protein
MLRAVTKENCYDHKMNETTNNASWRKTIVPRISEVFYLASDSYHKTGRIPEHCATSVMLCLQSGLGQGPRSRARPSQTCIKGWKSARYITDCAGALSGY